MKSPELELEPTPVKVINAAVLSCLDDVFYRLPFPNQLELEKLIKEAQGVTQMTDFRDELRDGLTGSRALKEFESGWDRYWAETQSQKRAAASRGQQTQSIKDRCRCETPETPEDSPGEDHGGGGQKGQETSSKEPEAEVPRRLALLLPVIHSLLSPAFPAENLFHTAGGRRWLRMI